ncbi:20S proteasome subunit A/B [Haloplanus aerogenes]|uniref:20S proteasome subunit A/B n=1 Tax=Haloplanus aerogenes TaxID=660522 RepID=A0A3M0DCV3_9EURY|nr:20S proteasome subunit A/B [Haloplanus aerogenes]AZH26978.1 20S proteasome subunit A/B [Haloplanus aerogenes]RMB13533.1 proteasome beta subunit [Haloplanus aerogenes]
MSTVLGVTCAGGVVLAGDRVAVSQGHVRSRSRQHVFDFEGVGAAVVGSDVDGFADRLESDLRTYRTERGEVHVDPLTRMASDLATEFDVSVLVAGYDDGGTPQLRSITADGSSTDDDLAAFGSGAPVALGALEASHDPDATLDDAETLARGALHAAAERDAGTGDDIDSYGLPA